MIRPNLNLTLLALLWLQIIGSGVVGIGLLGNVLNLVVLTRPSLKGVTYTYLIGLAVSDIGVDVLWTHLNTAFAGTATLAANGARPAGVYSIADQDVVSVLFRIQRNFLP